MSAEGYERITERIVALLEKGTVPWQKSWKVSTGWPRNLITKKPYRGINVLLLLAMGYESPYWLTFRQAIERGGSVKKGEKACPVVFWKRLAIEDNESEKKREISLLRNYHVFNLAQCESVKNGHPTNEDPAQALACVKPEEIVANMPKRPAIKDGFTQAFYAVREDYVGMPDRDRFSEMEQYYATLFHELVHSTGHESRLNRPTCAESAGYGSDPYCKEELIAEIGAAFLCGHAEIVDRTIDSSAAYIAGWSKKLKSETTLLVQAAAQAQRAADFVLNFKPEKAEVSHD